jgi:hypothetical protein
MAWMKEDAHRSPKDIFERLSLERPEDVELQRQR